MSAPLPPRPPRVLFLHLPNNHELARLDTMPFAYNVVKQLAADGLPLSLCLWERRLDPYTWLRKHPNVRLHFIRRGPMGPLPRRFLLHKYRWLSGILRAAGTRFDLIFAVGPKALIFASCIKRFFGGRIVYLNDELPSCYWTDPRLKIEECAAARHLEVLVAPDACRIAPSLTELGLPSTLPSFALPNAPAAESFSSNFDWQGRLGIPPGTKIVLHAGSVYDWSQVPEIMFAARDFPDGTAVVIHSRGGDHTTQYRKSLQHLHTPGRVFWSTDSVSEAELGSMIASSVCTLGLYRNTVPNIELVGMSSGKIMRSIVAGIPVLASRLDSLRFIEDFGLGVRVDHPREIPAAVARIVAENATMSENCRRFAREQLDHRKLMDGLMALAAPSWRNHERPERAPDST